MRLAPALIALGFFMWAEPRSSNGSSAGTNPSSCLSCTCDASGWGTEGAKQPSAEQLTDLIAKRLEDRRRPPECATVVACVGRLISHLEKSPETRDGVGPYEIARDLLTLLLTIFSVVIAIIAGLLVWLLDWRTKQATEEMMRLASTTGEHLESLARRLIDAAGVDFKLNVAYEFYVVAQKLWGEKLRPVEIDKKMGQRTPTSSHALAHTATALHLTEAAVRDAEELSDDYAKKTVLTLEAKQSAAYHIATLAGASNVALVPKPGDLAHALEWSRVAYDSREKSPKDDQNWTDTFLYVRVVLWWFNQKDAELLRELGDARQAYLQALRSLKPTDSEAREKLEEHYGEYLAEALGRRD
jgi:hypothetical protein